MVPQEAQYCRNPPCNLFGQKGQGNIRFVRKYGKYGDRTEYRCHSCGKSFASTRDTPMFGLHSDLRTVRAVVVHASEGDGVRTTARMVGIHPNTVNRIIDKVGEHLEWFLAECLKGVDLTEVQMDELWTFVQKKKAGDDPEELEAGHGETWIWTALDTRTRLLLCWWVGRHELSDAREMFKRLHPIIKADPSGELPLFTSDELPHYATVLKEFFHTVVETPRTGKPGRPANPKIVPAEDLVYGTIHKIRKNGRVRNVHKKLVFGDPEALQAKLAKSPSNTLNTSYIERSNGDWRLWDSHLTRKTLCFAKNKRLLNAKLAICVAVYNFVRPHGTLSKKRDGVGRKTTPAMAGKLADRPWKYEELLLCPLPRF